LIWLVVIAGGTGIVCGIVTVVLLLAMTARSPLVGWFTMICGVVLGWLYLPLLGPLGSPLIVMAVQISGECVFLGGLHISGAHLEHAASRLGGISRGSPRLGRLQCSLKHAVVAMTTLCVVIALGLRATGGINPESTLVLILCGECWTFLAVWTMLIVRAPCPEILLLSVFAWPAVFIAGELVLGAYILMSIKVGVIWYGLRSIRGAGYTLIL